MSSTPARVLTRAIRSDALRTLTQGALDAGFDGYFSGSGHLRLVNPENGKSVWLSTTSNGAARAYKNTRAALKRAGYNPEEHDMPKGQRLTPNQIEQIGVMREAGIRLVDIAARLDISTKAAGDNSPAEYQAGGPKHGLMIGPIAARQNLKAFDAAQKKEARAAVAVMERPAEVSSTGGYRVAGKTPPGMRMRPEQFELLRTLLAEGGTNLEIAAKVGVSNWTVGQYRRKLREEELAPNVRAAQALNEIAAEPSIVDVVLQTTQDFTTYPLITDLIGRQRRYQSMLGEAERMGDEDLQIMLLSKLELSGLEKEIVAFWAQTHGDQTNGNGHS